LKFERTSETWVRQCEMNGHESKTQIDSPIPAKRTKGRRMT